MPLFLVSGISRVSGERMRLHVHATDRREAREIASRNGVTATGVEDLRRDGSAREARGQERPGRWEPGRR